MFTAQFHTHRRTSRPTENRLTLTFQRLPSLPHLSADFPNTRVVVLVRLNLRHHLVQKPYEHTAHLTADSRALVWQDEHTHTQAHCKLDTRSISRWKIPPTSTVLWDLLSFPPTRRYVSLLSWLAASPSCDSQSCRLRAKAFPSGSDHF